MPNDDDYDDDDLFGGGAKSLASLERPHVWGSL